MEIIKKFEPLFGEWQAESLIGVGSFGRVYKVKREDYGTDYYSALKYISLPQSEAEIKQLRYEGMDEASLSGYYGQMVKDISAEIRLMNKLRGHTNIVAYEDHKILEKPSGIGHDIFIRMELLTSLNEYMQQNPPTDADIIRLGIDICNALELCQKHNVIHRDIKPDNIFVSENGDFKLGDFGIARQLERTLTNLSKKGTFNYMAPEVYKGDRYNRTADMCSLGVVMYRLLNNNRLPFMPQDVVMPADREQALTRRMKGEVIPLPCNAQNRLGEIVLKACAYDALDRYASPQEMRAELVALRDGVEVLPATPVFIPNAPTADNSQRDTADATFSLFGTAGLSKTSPEPKPQSIPPTQSKLPTMQPMQDELPKATSIQEPKGTSGIKRGGLIAAAIAAALLALVIIIATSGKNNTPPEPVTVFNQDSSADAPGGVVAMPESNQTTKAPTLASVTDSLPETAPKTTPKPTSTPKATPSATPKPTPTPTTRPTPTPTAEPMQKLPNPTASKTTGTYPVGPFDVAFYCNFPAGTSGCIYFTLDGKEPTESSERWSYGTTRADSTLTFKVKAFCEGMIPSNTVTFTYKFEPVGKVEKPYTNLPSGSEYSTLSATLYAYCNTVGATIRYTLNGSEPTESSPIFTKLDIDSSYRKMTLKLKAFCPGMTPSDTATYNYTFNA